MMTGRFALDDPPPAPPAPASKGKEQKLQVGAKDARVQVRSK